MLNGFPYFPAFATSAKHAPTVEELKKRVEALQQEAAQLEAENSGLKKMLSALEDDALYVVVDTEGNRLTMRQGNKVIHQAKCGTGSRQLIQAESGKNWEFETPIGSFTVLSKERNPVWIRPDWSYVEENMPIPAPQDPDRLVRGVLGKYALILGNGYKIHGTKFTKLVGSHFTHGCVSLRDKDLELVYRTVPIGAKVYLY